MFKVIDIKTFGATVYGRHIEAERVRERVDAGIAKSLNSNSASGFAQRGYHQIKCMLCAIGQRDVFDIGL